MRSHTRGPGREEALCIRTVGFFDEAVDPEGALDPRKLRAAINIAVTGLGVSSA